MKNYKLKIYVIPGIDTQPLILGLYIALQQVQRAYKWLAQDIYFTMPHDSTDNGLPIVTCLVDLGQVNYTTMLINALIPALPILRTTGQKLNLIDVDGKTIVEYINKDIENIVKNPITWVVIVGIIVIVLAILYFIYFKK